MCVLTYRDYEKFLRMNPREDMSYNDYLKKYFNNRATAKPILDLSACSNILEHYEFKNGDYFTSALPFPTKENIKSVKS